MDTARRRAIGLRSAPLALALALAASLHGLGAMGCGGMLELGEAEFRAGSYPDAKRTFASLEAESWQWPLRRRVEYALYRGLTLDALGDEARAALWLRRAAAMQAQRPGSLSDGDARRLSAAADVLFCDSP